MSTAVGVPVRRSSAAALARPYLAAAGIAAALAAAVATRAAQLHQGLLYPDGYQYLLMARGLAEHGSTSTRLGPAGDVFVPSLDAAAKPLFPLVVAAADVAGADPLVAARALTALAAGAVVVLAALVVRRLSGSTTAGAVTGMALLLSPAAGYWGGFAGPDAPAQALALAAVLAACSRAPTLAGALAGLAVTARPELAAVALAAAIACLAAPRLRTAATAAATAGLMTIAGVLALTRPPLALPPPSVVAAAGVATLLVAAGLVAAVRTRLAPVACVAWAALLAWVPAGAGLARTDGVLLVLGVAGLLVASSTMRLRAPAGCLATSAVALTVVYASKNPSSERYLSLLLPVAAMGIGLGVAALPDVVTRRVGTVVAAGAIAVAAVAAGVTASGPPTAGADAFQALAPRLPLGPDDVLLSSAADAYGFLLPAASVRQLQPGEHGVALLDGAQRLYDPRLGARGGAVATLRGVSFTRPDGSVDRRPTRLVRGVVVQRGG